MFSFVCTAALLRYSSLSKCTVIDQFGGPYSTLLPAKMSRLFFLPNCFVIYHLVFLTFMGSKSLKLSFTLNCVLKRANDLKNNFKSTRFGF